MVIKKRELSLIERNATVKLNRAGIKGSQGIHFQLFMEIETFERPRKCRKPKSKWGPSLLSERDNRKLRSVVKANRRNILHDICAIFSEFRP